ncbi:hypothetical protein CCMA1212_008481 [Trichoderma ghanense]|uniref:Uncharacterized protein n=1 Tax=Trichoderma ghanense TaxID=65468 RepID=A0ABY2GY28_9HYPO
MGLRDMIPALYIRLGRDQDAYDFIKWYATTGSESDYDWGDMSLPFLDTKNADVFAPQPSRAPFRQRSLRMIRGQLVGNIAGARPDILLALPEETSQLVDGIKRQIQALYRAVKTYNPRSWKLLVHDPGAGVLRRPAYAYSPRTEDEALLMLGYNYAAWYETPGAVDMLKSLGK